EDAVLRADDEFLAPHLVLAAAPPHPADVVELADRLEGRLDSRLRVEGQAEQILMVARGEVDGARMGRGVGRFGTHGRKKKGYLQGEQRQLRVPPGRMGQGAGGRSSCWNSGRARS